MDHFDMSAMQEMDGMSTSINDLIPEDQAQDQAPAQAQAQDQQAPVESKEELAIVPAVSLSSLLRDSIIVVCIFWVFASPFMYQQVNNFMTVLQPNGLPAQQGLLLHGVVSGLVYFLSQKFLL